MKSRLFAQTITLLWELGCHGSPKALGEALARPGTPTRAVVTWRSRRWHRLGQPTRRPADRGLARVRGGRGVRGDLHFRVG